MWNSCYLCIASIGTRLSWQWAHSSLTHLGRVTHICVSYLTIIGSDNGLSPGRRQAIIWTNAGILLIRPLGTNFSEISIEILTFSLKKMCLKVPSAKWRPFCVGLTVFKVECRISCGTYCTEDGFGSTDVSLKISTTCINCNVINGHQLFPIIRLSLMNYNWSVNGTINHFTVNCS